MDPTVELLCKQFWDWRMKEWPEFATFCGCHDHDEKLNDHSAGAFTRRKDEAVAFLQQLEVIRSTSSIELSKSDQVTMTLLSEELKAFINGVDHQGYLFALTYCDGILVDFETLTSWMPFSTPRDYNRYLARLKALPARIKSDIELLETGMQCGRTLHRVSVEETPEQLAALDKPAEDTIFFAPFLAVSENILPDVNQIKDEARSVIQNDILPAVRQLKLFIEKDYQSGCRPTVGVSSLPGGEEFYRAALQWHTSVPLSPQEVHDMGLKEVARIRAEMEDVMRTIGFEGDFKAFLESLRTQDRFYYSTKQDLLAAFSDICDNQIRPKLKKLFKNIPESRLMIEESPASKPSAPVAYYLAGTPDGARPGKCYVNCQELKNCPKYDMMTLALHEGEPGHHFQGMYAMESTEMPSFRRLLEDMLYNQPPSKFPLHTAYCEGWGLYCEYLGKELGLYDDPYSLFGHLSFEMHRAGRLVVDTGLHVLGWSFEEAVSYFMKHTALAEGAIRNEVKRYCTWPGQACAYKIGQMTIMKLREEASEALGSRFDVREFHEVALKAGMVPLPILETLVQEYIDAVLETDPQ